MLKCLLQVVFIWRASFAGMQDPGEIQWKTEENRGVIVHFNYFWNFPVFSALTASWRPPASFSTT
jgi:hypothetical protein